MKQIEIFKTNVSNDAEAERIIKLILKNFSCYRINFDLEDCDRILRIEAFRDEIDKTGIEQLLALQGYCCCHLQ